MPTSAVPDAATLAEKVMGVLRAAAEPLTYAQVKTGLNKAKVKTKGTNGVTERAILDALGTEGIHEHPPKTGKGKSNYWHEPPPTPPTPLEIMRPVVLAKVAALGDEPVAASKLGKPSGKKATAEADAAFDEALKELVAAGKLFRHDGGKYGKHKPLTEREVAEKRVRDKLKTLGDEPVAVSELGLPARASAAQKAAFAEVVEELIDLRELFRHDGGKYGKHKPPPLPWYKTPTHKNDFAAAFRLAESKLVGLDQLVAALRQELDHQNQVVKRKDDPPIEKPVVKLLSPAKNLRGVLVDAYNHLVDFVEFRATRHVHIPRLYHVAKKQIPDLTHDEFARELWQLGQEREVELQVENSPAQVTEPDLAIWRDGHLYYYARWKANS